MAVPTIDLTHEPPRLAALVEEAARSGEVLLTRGGEAVAKIVPLTRDRAPRRPGSARGMMRIKG